MGSVHYVIGEDRMRAIERTGEEFYCQACDVELIKSIVRSLPTYPLCVNIGAAYGTSALAMLEARIDSRVCSIDIEDCPEEYQLMAENNFIDLDRYRFYKGRSQDIGKMWKENSVDFVFVDGGHTYDECYEDGRVWYRIVKPKGFIAFHDYESRIKVLESVKRAVDQLVIDFQLKQVAREGTTIVFWKVGTA